MAESPIISPTYQLTRARGGEYAETFMKECMVHLPGFLTEEGLARFRSEIREMESHGQRRDLDTFGAWSTPRRFRAIGAQTIRGIGSIIPTVFESSGLQNFISGMVGTKAVPYGDPHENMAVMILEKPNDEHGAHCDEFPFAFNIALEVPPQDAGGVLQYAPQTRSIFAFSGRQRETSPPLEAGDAYLMHSGSTIHRVTGLTKEGCRRVMLSYSFSTPALVNRPSASGAPLFGDE